MMKTINRTAETVRKSAAVALSSLFILGSLAMPVYANAENSTDVSESVTAENTTDPGTAGTTENSGTENTVGSADTGTSAGGADTAASASGNGSAETTPGSGGSSESSGNGNSASPSGNDSTAAASGDSYGNGMTDPPLTSKEAANSTGETSGSAGSSLTPSGNMNLVDDLDGGNREFLTVTTKDGNYFYLIIDRNDDGTGNVYFLNKVDEEDLLSLMDDKTASKVREDLKKQSEEQEVAEASVTSSSSSDVAGGETDKTGRTAKTAKTGTEADAQRQTGAEKAVIYGGCAAIAGVVIAAAVRKRKKKGESRDQDDSYDDEYEEEYDFPEEEEGPGDENDEDGS